MTYKIIDGKGIIPELVRVIESGAFRDCESLTSIEIPCGVKEICNDAFTGCDLQSVTIKTLEKDRKHPIKDVYLDC